MYNLKEQTYNDFLKNLSQKLGFDVDRNSFDYDILKALFEQNNDYKREVQNILSKVIFENMRGQDLDNFLSFFNIYRRQDNDENLYTLTLSFKSNNNSFNIKEDCLMLINNNVYKNIKNISVSNEREEVTVQRIYNQEIKNQISGNNGLIVLDSSYCSVENGNLSDESSKLFVISLKQNVFNKESDFEFLERSKNILQELGYDNKTKIKEVLLRDSRIKNIKIKEEDNVTNIIIYPFKIDEIDEIINSNKHIVEYYKNSIVNLVKPNLYVLNIEYLKEQLSYFPDFTNLIVDVESEVKNFLSNLYVGKDNKIRIKKFNLIKLIDNFLSSRYENVYYDLKPLEVSVDFYFRNNYKDSIYSIDVEDYIDIDDYNMISFGKVN
jgi:hypothetical protein|nr:MAG TPA: hypothetical protein [Caudoviricetes sp.]